MSWEVRNSPRHQHTPAGETLYRRCVAEWSPEIFVDPELARRLIRDQFHDLPATQLRLLGTGWDNTVYLVDEAWVFRFPRRKTPESYGTVRVACPRKRSAMIASNDRLDFCRAPAFGFADLSDVPASATPGVLKTCTYGETREFPAFDVNVVSLEVRERMSGGVTAR